MKTDIDCADVVAVLQGELTQLPRVQSLAFDVRPGTMTGERYELATTEMYESAVARLGIFDRMRLKSP